MAPDEKELVFSNYDMIRADGCFAALKYLVDNGSPELFDEEV